MGKTFIKHKDILQVISSMYKSIYLRWMRLSTTLLRKHRIAGEKQHIRMSDIKIADRQRHLKKLKHFSRACCFKTQPKTNTIMFNKFPIRIQAHTICPAYVHFRQTSRHSFFLPLLASVLLCAD